MKVKLKTGFTLCLQPFVGFTKCPPAQVFSCEFWENFQNSFWHFTSRGLLLTINLFIQRWHRSNHRRCFVKKGVLKKFANFTGKHLRWSLFKFAGLKNPISRSKIVFIHVIITNLVDTDFSSISRTGNLLYLEQSRGTYSSQVKCVKNTLKHVILTCLNNIKKELWFKFHYRLIIFPSGVKTEDSLQNILTNNQCMISCFHNVNKRLQ